MTGITATHRHGLVCGAIGRALAASGNFFVPEPSFYDYGDHARRPDFTAFLSGQTIAVDVTIVTPDAAPGKAAIDAAKAKVEKHGAAVEQQGHEFVPLAFESWGHCDPAVDAFIKQIQRSSPPWCAPDIADELRRGISAAIAKGSTCIVRSAVEKLRRTASYNLAGPTTLE